MKGLKRAAHFESSLGVLAMKVEAEKLYGMEKSMAVSRGALMVTDPTAVSTSYRDNVIL